MEDSFAPLKAADKHFHTLLANPEEPILSILQALEDFRQLSQEAIFADFEHGVERRGGRLWLAHTETRKLLNAALARVPRDQPVTARQIAKLYLRFVKDSQRFYRDYITRLSKFCGGIPELEAAARLVKDDGADESPQPSITPGVRAQALEQCHHALIYLGDISRYRASAKLDKSPDFGPAIGYYGLACQLFPSNGMGQHQQAVVALAQRHHLRAIYHLYRAIVVEHPHPLAKDNLKREFDKANVAWDRGLLIQKGVPNDPDGPRRTLVGWFVRLHSMCIKGTPFRGYDELEREVISQLTAEIKRRPMESTVSRMLLVNFASQFCAGELFQGTRIRKHLSGTANDDAADPSAENHHAFFHFFRFNIRTFTALLRVFGDELQSVDNISSGDIDIDLASRLSLISRRVLPGLRLYTSWLLPAVQLLAGLADDDFLKDAIDQFWSAYAKALDIVAALFPIWDLEDLPEVNYMLEEDADTLGFKPLFNERSRTIWCDAVTGKIKDRFYERGSDRLEIDEEMLSRVKDFLSSGLYLATDQPLAPIKLRGTRVLLKDAEEPDGLHAPSASGLPVAVPPVAVRDNSTATPPPSQPRSAISTSLAGQAVTYAAVATNGLPKASPGQEKPPIQPTVRSRQAELSEMVDNLLEDEGDDEERGMHRSGVLPANPSGAPQSSPLAAPRGSKHYTPGRSSTSDLTGLPEIRQNLPQQSAASWSEAALTTPAGLPSPRNAGTGFAGSHSLSSVWNQSSSHRASLSPHFPPGLPTGSAGSPAPSMLHAWAKGHSRGNSGTSFQAPPSPSGHVVGDSWTSLESEPGPPQPPGFGPAVALPSLAGSGSWTAFESSIPSPLLFGAGGGPWGSGSPRARFTSDTPPNGQGGW